MRERSLATLLERIDEVDSHIKLFSGSLPRIRNCQNDLTRAHLTVVEDCLPFLKRLICYIGDTVPVMERMAQVVSQGTTDLGRVSDSLGEIDQTAERAVQEILDVLELSREELERASAAEDCGQRTREHIETAMNHLLSMIDSLQFQDITSQRVRATIHLLAELDHRLGSLVDDNGAEPEPSDLGRTSMAQAGSFDDRAVYDHDAARCRQEEIDQIMAQLDRGTAG